MKRLNAVQKLAAAAFLGFLVFVQDLPAQTENLPIPGETPAAEDLPADPQERNVSRIMETSETSAEKHRREIAEEASSTLFNMDLWDANVSLFLNGYWKGSLSVNWGLSNSPLGTSPDSKDPPLLFTQEADLTLSLWIWQKWFLEVSFIDDYDLNTYRAGYQGFPGETIQYVGVGNTGLDFPVFPYLDLGGDSPASFGLYGRFGSHDLVFHTLFRYDAAAREERIFVGNRERSFSNIVPDRPLRGRSFVLPDFGITSDIAVYLEDKNGSLLDTNGRRWRIAGPSEYAVSARDGLVELVREHPGMAAVRYAEVTSTGTLGMGLYTDAPGTSFLGDVQDHFGPGIVLSNYPQPGSGTNAPGTVTIPGIGSALVIYEPGTFSPFERMSRYLSPSNTTEDAALIRFSTGERLKEYDVLPANTLSLDLTMYTLTGDDTSRSIFEIITVNGGGRDRRTPHARWPLSKDPATLNPLYPELYLPGSPIFNEDIRLRFTNYGAPGVYSIGSDAIPGSVQVYRGGILDSQVSYDPSSGIVSLANPAGFNEVIRISYLKRSQERRLGSLAAGVGLVYKPEDSPFSAEAALGMRWNVSQEAYTEEGAASPGTVGFGARTSWDYERLKVSLSLGLGFEQPDTTGLYRIAGMEGNSGIVLGVSTSAGFISEKTGSFLLNNRVPLVYRNYRKSNWLGGSELQSIEWNAPVVAGLQGPYPAKDGDIDIFVAEFENLNTSEWTGFQAPLGRDGDLLEQAKAIVIPVRLFDFDPNIRVIVQFGSLAEEGYGGGENPDLVVENFPVFVPSSSSWDEIMITLTDDLRRKLRNAGQMRIIIQSIAFSGRNRLLVAKPVIYGASWRAITLDSPPIPPGNARIKAALDTALSGVSIAEVIPTLPLKNSKIDRLHLAGSNHVLQVDWKGINYAAGSDGRTAYIPLSDYRVLSFYFRGPLPTGTKFHFLVAQGPDAYYLGETALELVMDSSYFTGGWQSVEIHYREGRVLIDGVERPGIIKYNPGILRRNFENGEFPGEGQSGYIAVFISDTASIPDGSFYVDEICLEKPAPSYRVNGGAAMDWQHPEALLTIGNKEIVSGAAFNTALESAVQGDPFNNGGESFTGAQSRSWGKITILDTRLSGNLNFMVFDDTSYWSAGHGVGRSFGPLSISEVFNTSPSAGDETMNHSLSLGLDTPVFGNWLSFISYQNQRLRRFWSASIGMRPEQNGRPGFSLNGSLNYLEKTERIRSWLDSYAETWTQSWIIMIPDKGESSLGMQNREAQGRAGFSFNRQLVGVDLSFEGNSAVSAPLATSRTGSMAHIDTSFKFGVVRGNLRFQRDIFQTLPDAGNDIGSDLHRYGESLSDTAPLWREIPIYSFFDPNLDSAMDKTRYQEMENTRFHEVMGLNLLFPERYNVLSLIIPASGFTRLERTMEQRMDTRLDVLTLSSGLGFSSINLFGAMGSRPVFNIYRNDEFRHSLTGIISFPRSEDPLWRIQAEQNLRAYGFKGSELGLQNTYTAIGGNNSGWIESFNLIWTIPREKTLLSAIYSAGMEKIQGRSNFPVLLELAQNDYERLSRETLELALDNSGEHGFYYFSFCHESVIRIIGKLTFTSFAKLGLQRDVYYDEFSLMLSFGTTLTISF